MEDIVSSELVTELISVVALILVSVITYLLKKGVDYLMVYLEVKIGVEKVEMLKAQVETVVSFVEQNPAFSEWGGAQKKEYVLGSLQTFVEKYGLEISYEQLDRLLERAVQVMNTQIKTDA